MYLGCSGQPSPAVSCSRCCSALVSGCTGPGEQALRLSQKGDGEMGQNSIKFSATELPQNKLYCKKSVIFDTQTYRNKVKNLKFFSSETLDYKFTLFSFYLFIYFLVIKQNETETKTKSPQTLDIIGS